MLESAGPGRISVMPRRSFMVFSHTAIPFPISVSSIFKPSFARPLQPYHSQMRKIVPRGQLFRRPSESVTSVPSDSAHHPTENGFEEPQSKERFTYHDLGILKRGTMWTP